MSWDVPVWALVEVDALFHYPVGPWRPEIY
jgi:hypothetical protein